MTRTCYGNRVHQDPPRIAEQRIRRVILYRILKAGIMSVVAGRTTQTWRRLRKQCFNRDKAKNAPCWICNQPINYNAKPSSTPDSYEPDHRHSVKTHPELAEVPENILPSHKKCNRSRGAKAGINNLGRPSREW